MGCGPRNLHQNIVLQPTSCQLHPTASRPSQANPHTPPPLTLIGFGPGYLVNIYTNMIPVHLNAQCADQAVHSRSRGQSFAALDGPSQYFRNKFPHNRQKLPRRALPNPSPPEVAQWPKAAPSWPLVGPGRHQVDPSWPEVGPSWPRVRLKLVQVSPQMAQDGSKIAQKLRRVAPKRLQGGPKLAQVRAKMAPQMAPQMAKMAPR